MGTKAGIPMIKGYDQWKLRNPRDTEKVCFECDYCGGEVYEGIEYYKTVDGDRVHCDCFHAYAAETLILMTCVAGEDSA
jgi:hypothetical protein